MKKEMKAVKNTQQKIKAGITRLFLILQGVLFMGMPVKASGGKSGTHANALQNTKLVTGLIKLIKDATTAALLIEAGLVILFIVIELMKRQAAPDEEKAKHEKNAKSILIVGVLIVSVTALVPVVLSYFQ